MSDAIDDFKAMRHVKRLEREERWNTRHVAIAAIEALGFKVRTLSAESRHLRVGIPGSGWFDFWPSTTRWAQSSRKGGRRGARGFGADNLIEALKKEAAR